MIQRLSRGRRNRSFFKAHRVLIAACLAAVGFPAHGQPLGDLNDDCGVDVADVLLLGRHLSGAAPIPGLESSGRADVAPLDTSGQSAPDGLTNSADLLIFLQILRGVVASPVQSTTITNPGFAQTTANPIQLSGTKPLGSVVHILVNGVEDLSTASGPGAQSTSKVALPYEYAGAVR